MDEQDSDADLGNEGRSKLASAEESSHKEMLEAEVRNQRIGLRLFALYALFYGGFVFVNAFATDWSDWEPIEGLNLAVLWGFALILLAFVLAMVYGVVCRVETAEVNATAAADTHESEAEA